MSKVRVPKPKEQVWVYWMDIAMDGFEEWLSPRNKPTTPAPIQTAGFIVKEDDDTLVVCQNFGDDKERGPEIAIPRGTIIEIRDVTVGEKRAWPRKQRRR